MFVAPDTELDEAAAALWAVFPDGPPKDVEEPRENEFRIFARCFALKAFGEATAMRAFPHLFVKWRGGVSL